MSKDRPTLGIHETELSRDLAEFDITMIGVGAMIGAGIFVLTGIAAGTAGPALMLSFALNGVVTIFTAMVYAELGSAIPEAGGGYLWVKDALGKSNGFLAGWMSWFSHAVAGSLYALGFGAYFALLLEDLGIHFFGLEGALVEKSVGVLVVLVFLYINYRGVSETGRAGNIVTLAKIATIGLFIVFGIAAMFRNPGVVGQFVPFFPQGYGNVFLAMGITFIAFEGYEVIVQAGEEVRNPRRSIPRAVFWSLMIVVPIYVGVAVVAIGAVQVSGTTAWEFLGQHRELGLAEVARQFMPFGTLILLFGGLLSTVSALNATTYSSTRVSFAMGRDRVLPAFFAKVHEQNRTPYVAVLLTGVLIIFMVIAIPLEDVAAAADVMFLLLFLQVNYAVMRIRDEFGDRLEYGYLMPFYPWVPMIGIVTKSFLAIYLYRFSPTAWFSASLWIVAGLAIFFVYSRERLQESERPRIAYEVKRGPRKRQRILVPIADVNHIETELTLAAALARKGSGENAEIIALNVIVIPPQLPLSEGEQYAAQAWPLLDQIHRFAERFDDVTVNTVVGIGHQISQVIANVAEREEAVYIVMGWKGTVHADRVRGSVAQAVLLGAPSDTIVIKDQGLPEKVEEILVAVAPRVHVSEALKAAADLADGFDARLRLISIATPRKHPRETPERLARWLEKIKNDLTAVGVPADRIQTQVLEAESVKETLIQEAEKSDLLVMGASRDWVVRQYLVGSFPDEIANRLETTTTVMVKKEEPRAISAWHRLVGLLPMR